MTLTGLSGSLALWWGREVKVDILGKERNMIDCRVETDLFRVEFMSPGYMEILISLGAQTTGILFGALARIDRRLGFVWVILMTSLTMMKN